jgi:hypothetical protein
LERRTDERGTGERFDFGRVWRVAAYVLFAAAFVLILLRRSEAAVAVGALGAAAWFVNVRNNVIRKHDLVKVGGRNWRPRREVEKEEAAAAAEEDDE